MEDYDDLLFGKTKPKTLKIAKKLLPSIELEALKLKMDDPDLYPSKPDQSFLNAE